MILRECFKGSPLNPPVNGGKLTLPVYGEGRGGEVSDAKMKILLPCKVYV